MKNKALSQIMNQEVLIASALWVVAIVLLLGFFFRFITLILAILMFIASFFYSKDLVKNAKNN